MSARDDYPLMNSRYPAAGGEVQRALDEIDLLRSIPTRIETRFVPSNGLSDDEAREALARHQERARLHLEELLITRKEVRP